MNKVQQERRRWTMMNGNAYIEVCGPLFWMTWTCLAQRWYVDRLARFKVFGSTLTILTVTATVCT